MMSQELTWTSRDSRIRKIRQWLVGPALIVLVSVGMSCEVYGPASPQAADLHIYRLKNPDAPIGVVPLRNGDVFYYAGGQSTYGIGVGLVSRNGAVREYFIALEDQLNSVALVNGSTLWATADKGAIVTISGKSALLQTRLPKAFGSPGKLIVAPDGSLIFALQYVGAVARLRPGGKPTIHRLAGMEGVSSLALARNGDIYAAGESTGPIRKLDATNRMTVLPSTRRMNIGSMAAGPDGGVWFTDLNSGHLGHLDNAGRLEEVLVSKRAFDSGVIAVGPDFVWVAVDGGVVSYQIRSRKMRSIPIPQINRAPMALAVSPTGLWGSASVGSDCLAVCYSIFRIDPLRPSQQQLW
jgi:virginiamycin B lyase